MDEQARETFKFRFIKLTLFLNAIILLVAIGAFVLIRFRSPAGIAGGLVLLTLAVVIYVYFSRFYQQTKEWLAEHSGAAPEKD